MESGREGKLYHVERYNQELQTTFEDGTHIIYMNTEKHTKGPLGDLAHDFLCTDVDDMRCEVLAQKVRYYKEDEGVNEMCAIFEEIRQEGRMEGLQLGRQEGHREGLQEGLDTGRQKRALSKYGKSPVKPSIK